MSLTDSFVEKKSKLIMQIGRDAHMMKMFSKLYYLTKMSVFSKP